MKTKRLLFVLLFAVVVVGGAFSDIEGFSGNDYYRLNEQGRLSVVFGMVLISSWSRGLAYGLNETEAFEYLSEYFYHRLSVNQVMLGIDRYYRNNSWSEPLVFAYMAAIRP